MIDWKLKLIAVIFLLIVMGIITHFVKKNKIIIRYSILWFVSLIILIVFTIFPEVLGWLTKFVGFELSSNFLFILLIAFLFFICISLTIIVSEQKEQIRRLIQEVSMLRSKEK